jgi:hypothetical protein
MLKRPLARTTAPRTSKTRPAIASPESATVRDRPGNIGDSLGRLFLLADLYAITSRSSSMVVARRLGGYIAVLQRRFEDAAAV